MRAPSRLSHPTRRQWARPARAAGSSVPRRRFCRSTERPMAKEIPIATTPIQTPTPMAFRAGPVASSPTIEADSSPATRGRCSSMARRRSMTAEALGGRRSGALASRSSSNSWTGCGTRGRTDDTGLGGCPRIAAIRLGMLDASYGGTPAIIRYSTTPRRRGPRGGRGPGLPPARAPCRWACRPGTPPGSGRSCRGPPSPGRSRGS